MSETAAWPGAQASTAPDPKRWIALVAPRKLTVASPSDRAKSELSGLKAWYATWGVDCDPLR